MKNYRKFMLLSVLLSIFIFSCKDDVDEIIEPVNTFENQVKEILDSVVIKEDVAGAALFAINNTGEEAWLASGLKNKETNEPLGKETKFRIASISKTFLAVTILQLMEEEELTMDTKYADILPDSVVELFPYGNEITVYQLLSHTSGLYDFEDDQFVDILFQNLLYQWTPWELMNHALNADSAVFFPPNTEYHYSNTNYILLGLIVEALTDKSLEQNIRERIIAPLSLNNTYSWEEAVSWENCATGYMAYGAGNMFVVNDQTLPLYFEWGHGQMVSTVYDLSLFFRALTNGKLFQYQETYNLMTDWTTLSGQTYGLGIDNLSGELGVGHDGSTGGNYSFASINPQTGAMIMLCFNQSSDTFMGAAINPIYKIINP